MRLRMSSVVILLAVSEVGSAFAQQVQTGTVSNGAPSAPSAAQAQAAPETASDPGPIIPTRAAPPATNPVLAAYVPQPTGLTANEVAVRAVATSDTIAAKNAELKAAAAAVDTTMYQFLPRLALKASYSRVSPVTVSVGDGYVVAAQSPGPIYASTQPNIPPGTPVPTPPAGTTAVAVDSRGIPVVAVPLQFTLPNDYYSLGASLGVPLSDYVLRLADSIDATKHNRDAIELNMKAERQKVEADARVAFYNWALSLGQVAVTEKSLERVKSRLKDAHAAQAWGAVTKADVLRLEALVASTEAGLVAAQSFRLLAQEHLSVIMNSPPKEFVIGEDVLSERSPLPMQSLETLVKQANARRYELQALDRSVDSLRHAEAVTHKGQVPRIDGFADYTYANPNQRYLFERGWKQTWDVGLAATWNVNEVFTSGSSAHEIAAKRKAIESSRNALAKGIRMEVTSAYADARRFAAALESAKRGAIAAQTAYDSEVELFKLGRATTTELIDAEAELVNAMLSLISAHINIRIAETKLARATGAETRATKS